MEDELAPNDFHLGQLFISRDKLQSETSEWEAEPQGRTAVA